MRAAAKIKCMYVSLRTVTTKKSPEYVSTRVRPLTWLMKRSKFLKSPELSNRPCTMITGLYATTETQRHAPSSGYSSEDTPLPFLLVVGVWLDARERKPFITTQNSNRENTKCKLNFKKNK